MNNPMMELITIRLRNQFELSKLSDKNLSVKTHAIVTTIGYLTVFVLVIGYAISLPYQMDFVNQLEMVNPYIFSLLYWVLGIWTLLSGVENILVGVDHEQVFVLPIEEWQAKILPIFSHLIVQITICTIVMFVVQIPLFLIHSFPLINLVIVGIYAVMTPLVAIGISIIVLLLANIFFTLIRVKNVMVKATSTLLLFISPLLYAYATLTPFNTKGGLINTSFLRYSLLEGLGGLQWLKIFVLFVGVVVIFSLLCFVIVKKYYLIIQLVKGKRTIAKPCLLKTNPIFIALLKKEISRYFSSFSYVINTILAPLALFITGTGLLFSYFPSFPPFVIESLDLTLSNPFMYSIILIACATLTTTTSCSFSFEGKNVWIIQSLPISIINLSIAKGLLNILLFLPGLLVSMRVFWSVFGLRGTDFISYTLLLFINMVFISIVGLFTNLIFSNYYWSNEMVAVKQGLSTIITAVISMILIVLSSTLLLFWGTTGVFFLLALEIVIIVFLIFRIKKTRYL